MSLRPKIRRIARCARSEEHTSELQSRLHLVCRLLLEKKNKIKIVLAEMRNKKLEERRRGQRNEEKQRTPVRREVGLRHDGPEERLLFFFNDTATTKIYTLSLHDALPI